MQPHLVVLSGAGISAESGLATFRDSGGLWERYRIEDVATPQAFAAHPQLVLDFYNNRLKQMRLAKPNQAHLGLAALEAHYRVSILTQNVDDLHERAGSSQVLHLHGELAMCRSSLHSEYRRPMPAEGLTLGQCCPNGAQLRPDVVWFGELVPQMDAALEVVGQADLLVVVGTSLQVYPAAGLIHAAPEGVPIYVIDPARLDGLGQLPVTHIKEKATSGVASLQKILRSNYWT